jgi:hypothetical protein
MLAAYSQRLPQIVQKHALTCGYMVRPPSANCITAQIKWWHPTLRFKLLRPPFAGVVGRRTPGHFNLPVHHLRSVQQVDGPRAVAVDGSEVIGAAGDDSVTGQVDVVLPLVGFID